MAQERKPLRFPDGKTIPIKPVEDLPDDKSRFSPKYGDMRLKQVAPDVVRVTPKLKTFGVCALCFGITAALIGVSLALMWPVLSGMPMRGLAAVGRGLVPLPLLIAGLYCLYMSVRYSLMVWRTPAVLDRRRRLLYWPRARGQEERRLDRVLAVQVCLRRIGRKGGHHDYAQLILVMTQGHERLALLSDEDRSQVLSWARFLADWLELPLVDDSGPTASVTASSKEDGAAVGLDSGAAAEDAGRQAAEPRRSQNERPVTWRRALVGGTRRLAARLGCVALLFAGVIAVGYCMVRQEMGGPLQRAAADGDVEAVKRLLAEGIPVDVRSEKHEWTPLHMACEGLREDVVKLLVERGADVNRGDKYGCKPLHFVAQPHDRGYPKEPWSDPKMNRIAEFLIANGAEAHCPDDWGYTPLHQAAIKRNTGLMRVLLKHGADPNAATDTGDTPLHYALGKMFGDPKVIGLLLQYGGDPERRNKRGDTPLSIARTWNPRAYQMMLKHVREKRKDAVRQPERENADATDMPEVQRTVQ